LTNDKASCSFHQLDFHALNDQSIFELKLIVKVIMFSIIVVALSYGCSGIEPADIDPDDIVIEDNVVGKYTFSVFQVDTATTEIISLYSIDGIETHWSPDIGYMSLGPEKTTACNEPRASLWMNLDSTALANGTVDVHDANWDFYSILFPSEDLGNQEANFYQVTSYTPPDDLWVIGVDDRGIQPLRGGVILYLVRTIINEGDVEDFLLVEATWTATHT
jgi:hypothetical protein